MLDNYICGLVADYSHGSADDLNEYVITFCEDALGLHGDERTNLGATEDDGMDRSESLYWTAEQSLSAVNNRMGGRYLWVDDNSLYIGCLYEATDCETCRG